MAIHTENELRNELSNNGSINMFTLKQMMRVLLDIIDKQNKEIENLKSRNIVYGPHTVHE